MSKNFRFPYAGDDRFISRGGTTRFTDGSTVVYVVPPALTGPAARRQAADRIAQAMARGIENYDKPLPLSGRAERRERDRNFARQQRKGVQKFMRKQMAHPLAMKRRAA